MMKSLTIAMPYYEAPQMLLEHLKWWTDYEPGEVSIVIVDDGSEVDPAHSVLEWNGIPEGLDLALFRIELNIPWNHAGARNLAMKHVKTEWALLTDIDHLLFPWAAKKLMRLSLDPVLVYQPPRYDRVDGAPQRTERHTDSYIITPEMFWNVGGYDEQFTGYWNGAFEPFRKALKRTTKIVEVGEGHLLRFNNTHEIPDANVTEWGRKGTEFDINHEPHLKKKQRVAMKKYKPQVLQFQWEQLI